MTRTELIVQLLKVAIGLAFGAYFVWWSLEVLDRLAPENEEPTPAVGRMVKVHAAPEGSPWMWTLGKPLKRILERAHQYRVIAEGLQFHLDRENLPNEAADLVRIAQPALAEAAGVVEESEADMRTLASTCPPRAMSRHMHGLHRSPQQF
jgi:hypothetical protein